jgi:hypothetical protein
MATKTSIIGELGEAALLLPQHLQRALAANDRLKFCFTLLQAAENHASHPEDPPLDLKAERIAANLPAGELDAAVALSRREADGALHLGGAARLQQEMLEDIASMSAPLALAGSGEAETFSARARTLLAALPPFADDRVPAGLVGAMTSANRGAGDSLHILVMDLHKAINALQAALAEESIDGARVWRIDAADRPLIRAFMSGLNETARLKFDHPGLATIATRSGARLVIENDIGTTDAHVLVLHVEGLSAILDLYRCACAAAQILPEALRALRRALGRHARAQQRAARRRAELLSVHRPLRRGRREDARALSRLPRHRGSFF